MSKYANDDMLDVALDYILNNCATMTLCSAQPTNFTEANATYALADTTLVSGDFAAKADTTGGRKIAVPEKASVSVDTTGIATHVAVISATELLYVTTCVSQSLTSGNSVTIPTWDIEVKDPA